MSIDLFLAAAGPGQKPGLNGSTPAPSRLHDTALTHLDAAAQRLHLDPAIHELLRRPERELTVAVPLERDDGSFTVLRGYRVQHSTVRGPGKGGIRYHPGVTLDEVSGLAA